ncbi:hypothetical protein N7507_010026 [Penicillium longicatenatum]|nr:hypothetical protein N7507_010026 [Penicillium longicatenatum]
MRQHYRSYHLPQTLVGLTTAELYDGGCNKPDAPVHIRVGTGGAGQSGLVKDKELSNKYIQSATNNCGQNHFQIEWVTGDTTETILNLKSGAIDMGITYNKAAELLAIEDGTASGCDTRNACRLCKEENLAAYKDFCGSSCECCEKSSNWPCYLFRDHFYLVGPNETVNPAGLDKQRDNIENMFAKLYSTAENSMIASSANPVRFLSRYDKSATNILDSAMWIGIGQTPWANPASKWYHQYSMYPVQALEAAIRLREYTITDRGTHLTLRSQQENLMDEMAIYKSGVNDKKLLNEGHVIFGTKDMNRRNLAWSFWRWLGTEGQDVVVNFHKGDGVCLYKGYPRTYEIQPTECRFELEVREKDMDTERVELR